MHIDLSNVITCENKVVIEKVPIELESFKSRLGDFPIIEKAPVELRIANQENKRLLIHGVVDFTALIPCGRCLEEVPTNIHFEIEKEMKLLEYSRQLIKANNECGLKIEAIRKINKEFLKLNEKDT